MLYHDVNFWRDRAILDFGISAQKFNQSLHFGPHEVDASLVLYAPSNLPSQKIMKDFARHGPVSSVVRYPNFWVITYTNVSHAINRWIIYENYGNILYEDHRYGKGRLEKYDPRLVFQYREKSAYFALWKQSNKQKIPDAGEGILLGDVKLALNVV